jgi:hypothetical protein
MLAKIMRRDSKAPERGLIDVYLAFNDVTPIKTFPVLAASRFVDERTCLCLIDFSCGSVSEFAQLVSSELGLDQFQELFELKLVAESTEPLCTFVAGHTFDGDKMYSCKTCRIDSMCSVCKNTCHSAHQTALAEEVMPARCWCGSGSELRVKTNHGQACHALIKPLVGEFARCVGSI